MPPESRVASLQGSAGKDLQAPYLHFAAAQDRIVESAGGNIRNDHCRKLIRHATFGNPTLEPDEMHYYLVAGTRQVNDLEQYIRAGG